jgi:hypothetical protein
LQHSSEDSNRPSDSIIDPNAGPFPRYLTHPEILAAARPDPNTTTNPAPSTDPNTAPDIDPLSLPGADPLPNPVIATTTDFDPDSYADDNTTPVPKSGTIKY